MKILIQFTFLFFSILSIKAQSLTISETTVFIQKKVLNVNCNASNPNPKFYINGTYDLSTTQVNGRNEYRMLLPPNLTTSICILNIFPYTLPSGNNYLLIRWTGTEWRLGFITSSNLFQQIASFAGDTPIPRCETFSQNNNVKIGGQDCYCNVSINLDGTENRNTPRVAQNSINSTQIITNANDVLYQAGKSITLDAGFSVTESTVFKAQIGGCN